MARSKSESEGRRIAPCGRLGTSGMHRSGSFHDGFKSADRSGPHWEGSQESIIPFAANVDVDTTLATSDPCQVATDARPSTPARMTESAIDRCSPLAEDGTISDVPSMATLTFFSPVRSPHRPQLRCPGAPMKARAQRRKGPSEALRRLCQPLIFDMGITA